MATDFGKLEFSTSFKLLNAIPLDARSYFESYEEALAAAQSAVVVNTPLATSNYYIGQMLTVVDPATKQSEIYTITKDGSDITLVKMPNEKAVEQLLAEFDSPKDQLYYDITDIIPKRVTKIKVDSRQNFTHNNKTYIASTIVFDNPNSGLWETEDDFVTFTRNASLQEKLSVTMEVTLDVTNENNETISQTFNIGTYTVGAASVHAFDSNNKTIILVGTDNGKSNITVSTITGDENIDMQIIADATNNARHNTRGVWMSIDNGQTWQHILTPSAIEGKSISGCWDITHVSELINETQKDVVYVSCNGITLVRSENLTDNLENISKISWEMPTLFDTAGNNIDTNVDENNEVIVNRTTSNAVFYDIETGMYVLGCTASSNRNDLVTGIYLSENGKEWYACPITPCTPYGFTKVNGIFIGAIGDDSNLPVENSGVLRGVYNKNETNIANKITWSFTKTGIYCNSVLTVKDSISNKETCLFAVYGGYKVITTQDGINFSLFIGNNEIAHGYGIGITSAGNLFVTSVQNSDVVNIINIDGEYALPDGINTVHTFGNQIIDGKKTFIQDVIVPRTNYLTNSYAAATKSYVDEHNVYTGINASRVTENIVRLECPKQDNDITDGNVFSNVVGTKIILPTFTNINATEASQLVDISSVKVYSAPTGSGFYTGKVGAKIYKVVGNEYALVAISTNITENSIDPEKSEMEFSFNNAILDKTEQYVMFLYKADDNGQISNVYAPCRLRVYPIRTFGNTTYILASDGQSSTPNTTHSVNTTIDCYVVSNINVMHTPVATKTGNTSISTKQLEITDGINYAEKTSTVVYTSETSRSSNLISETNPTLSNVAKYNIAENTADIQVGIMKPTVENPDTTNPNHFATSGEIHVASMADSFTNGSRSIVSIRDNTLAEHVVAKLDNSKKVAITTEYASMEGNIPFTTDRAEFHKTEFVTRDYVTPVIEEYQAFEISSYTSQYTDSSDNTSDVTCGVVALSSEIDVTDLSAGTHTFEITCGPIALTDLYDDGMLLVRIGHANNETIASGDNVGPFFAISTKHTYCKNGNIQTILANSWNTSIWNTAQGSTNKIRLTVDFTANNTITYTTVINDRVTITQAHNNIGAAVYSLNYINLYHTTFANAPTVNLQTRYDINNVIHNYDNETIAGQKTFTQDVIIPETTDSTLPNAAITKGYVDNIIINNDNSAVHLTGQETITGQKTFTQDVIIPETTDDTPNNAASTKQYVEEYTENLLGIFSDDYIGKNITPLMEVTTNTADSTKHGVISLGNITNNTYRFDFTCGPLTSEEITSNSLLFRIGHINSEDINSSSADGPFIGICTNGLYRKGSNNITNIIPATYWNITTNNAISIIVRFYLNESNSRCIEYTVKINNNMSLTTTHTGVVNDNYFILKYINVGALALKQQEYVSIYQTLYKLMHVKYFNEYVDYTNINQDNTIFASNTNGTIGATVIGAEIDLSTEFSNYNTTNFDLLQLTAIEIDMVSIGEISADVIMKVCQKNEVNTVTPIATSTNSVNNATTGKVIFNFANIIINKKQKYSIYFYNSEQQETHTACNILTYKKESNYTNNGIVTGITDNVPSVRFNYVPNIKLYVKNSEFISVLNQDISINDSVVHKTRDETITGRKTFADPLTTTASACINYVNIYDSQDNTIKYINLDYSSNVNHLAIGNTQHKTDGIQRKIILQTENADIDIDTGTGLLKYKNDITNYNLTENTVITKEYSDQSINGLGIDIDYIFDDNVSATSPAANDRAQGMVGEQFNLSSFFAESEYNTLKLSNIKIASAFDGNANTFGGSNIFANIYECDISDSANPTGKYIATSDNTTTNAISSIMDFSFTNNEILLDTTKIYMIGLFRTNDDGQITTASCRLQTYPGYKPGTTENATNTAYDGNAFINSISTNTTFDESITYTYNNNATYVSFRAPVYIEIYGNIKINETEKVYVKDRQVALQSDVTENIDNITTKIDAIDSIVDANYSNIISLGSQSVNSFVDISNNNITNNTFEFKLNFSEITEDLLQSSDLLFRFGFDNSTTIDNTITTPYIGICVNKIHIADLAESIEIPRNYWNTNSANTINLSIRFYVNTNNVNCIDYIIKINENNILTGSQVNINTANHKLNFINIGELPLTNPSQIYIGVMLCKLVHTTGTEIISGNKTFTDEFYVTNTAHIYDVNFAQEDGTKHISIGAETGSNLAFTNWNNNNTEPKYIAFLNKSNGDIKFNITGYELSIRKNTVNNYDGMYLLTNNKQLFIDTNPGNDTKQNINIDSPAVIRNNNLLSYENDITNTALADNTVITKKYVDNIEKYIWSNLPLINELDITTDAKRCYYTEFGNPLLAGNYKLRFTFSNMSDLPSDTTFIGKALFRFGYAKNANNPFGFTITPAYIYINGTQKTDLTIPASYWNTTEDSLNVVELDISFTDTSANIITKINGNTIMSNNNPFIAVIPSTNETECGFRYFAIPGSSGDILAEGATFIADTSISSMHVDLYYDSVCINNNQTISGQKTFTQDVIIPETTSNTALLAAVTKGYVDNAITNINTAAIAATYTGIVEESDISAYRLNENSTNADIINAVNKIFDILTNS